MNSVFISIIYCKVENKTNNQFILTRVKTALRKKNQFLFCSIFYLRNLFSFLKRLKKIITNILIITKELLQHRYTVALCAINMPKFLKYSFILGFKFINGETSKGMYSIFHYHTPAGNVFRIHLYPSFHARI